GMKSFKAPYPFYRFDSLILEPMPGKVIQFDASTAYVNGARLAFHANFDLGNPFERFGGDTALTMTQDPEYVHEGTGSGYIYLDGPFKYSENVSLDPFRPSLSGPVYLEVNYKCNIPFQIGAVAFYSN